MPAVAQQPAPPIIHVVLYDDVPVHAFTDAAAAAKHVAGVPEQVAGRVRVERYELRDRE